eukprot:scaffold5382_cov267-Chaetoceros_neogracile.AAC.5
MRSLIPRLLISTACLALSSISNAFDIDIEKVTINRSKKPPTEKDLPLEVTFEDKLDGEICAQLESEHKCEDMKDFMYEYCRRTCYDLHMSKAYYTRIEFDDDLSDEFFALTAKNWTGTDLRFQDFDGYITVVMNIGITCDPGEDVVMGQKLTEFRKLMPYTLNLLVFPHIKKHKWFDTEDWKNNCTTFDELIKTKRETLHIMDLARVNRLVEDRHAMRLDVEEEEAKVHPVWKFLKKQVGKDFIDHDKSTFFFVNPVATSMDVLVGAPLPYLKKHIDEVLMGWENEL